MPDQDIQVDSMRAKVDFSQFKVHSVEEKEHHLGCLPIIEMKNTQKWLYELMNI